LSAARKWNSIRNEVAEANCDIICFVETKKTDFDQAFLQNILPMNFDDFLFAPSTGAFGGLLVAWKSQLFLGTMKSVNGFSMTVEFSCKLDEITWTLINVYGPCTSEGKVEFTNWLKSSKILNEEDWIILGDFNLYRYPEIEIDLVLTLVICSYSTASLVI